MPCSVAMVVLDTVRKDVFDEHFGWLDGLSFSNALSPSHWTTPVHAAMFVGAYPTEVGVHAKHLTLDVPGQTLGEKLQAAGWTCRGYSANGNISQSTRFDRGFDEFTAKGYHSSADIFDWQTFISKSDDDWRRFPRAVIECIRSDCDTIPSLKRGVRRKYDEFRYGGSPNLTVEDALRYLLDCSFGGQEFLFMNLMEAHPKYFPPERYRTVEPLSLDSIEALEAFLRPEASFVDEGQMLQTYKDSVRYLSDYYRQIHDALLEDFDYVITVSDHGETFGENGVYGHIPALVPEIVHVPLVIAGDVSGDTISTPVSVLDVHQTIASLTGIEDARRGRNLLDIDSDDRPCVTEAHGLSQWQRREFKDKEFSERLLDEVDSVRRGISIGNYYGYESISDGWVDVHSKRPEAETELERIVTGFDSPKGFHVTVANEVKSQMRDMGYL